MRSRSWWMGVSFWMSLFLAGVAFAQMPKPEGKKGQPAGKSTGKKDKGVVTSGMEVPLGGTTMARGSHEVPKCPHRDGISCHFWEGCWKGSESSCRRLRGVYKKFPLQQKKFETFQKENREGCRKKKWKSCLLLARIYRGDGPAPKKITFAFEAYAYACHLHKPVCGELHKFYRVVLHFEKDERHQELLQSFCDVSRYGRACFDLALLHDGGRLNTPQSSEKSTYYMRRACKRGAADACFRLGMMCQVGLEKPQDFSKAREWLAQACQQKHARGCEALSRLFRWGWGAKKDCRMATFLSKKACRLGIQSACKTRCGEDVRTSWNANLWKEAVAKKKALAPKREVRNVRRKVFKEPRRMKGEKPPTSKASVPIDRQKAPVPETKVPTSRPTTQAALPTNKGSKVVAEPKTRTVESKSRVEVRKERLRKLLRKKSLVVLLGTKGKLSSLSGKSSKKTVTDRFAKDLQRALRVPRRGSLGAMGWRSGRAVRRAGQARLGVRRYGGRSGRLGRGGVGMIDTSKSKSRSDVSQKPSKRLKLVMLVASKALESQPSLDTLRGVLGKSKAMGGTLTRDSWMTQAMKEFKKLSMNKRAVVLGNVLRGLYAKQLHVKAVVELMSWPKNQRNRVIGFLGAQVRSWSMRYRLKRELRSLLPKQRKKLHSFLNIQLRRHKVKFERAQALESVAQRFAANYSLRPLAKVIRKAALLGGTLGFIEVRRELKKSTRFLGFGSERLMLVAIQKMMRRTWDKKVQLGLKLLIGERSLRRMAKSFVFLGLSRRVQVHRVPRLGLFANIQESFGDSSLFGSREDDGKKSWRATYKLAAVIRKQMQAACEKGDQNSCFEAAFLLRNYRPVLMDEEVVKSHILEDASCQKGVASACLSLGVSLLTKGATYRDPKRAKSLLKKACYLGVGEACVWLAWRLEQSKDKAKAAQRLYETACQKGNGEACRALAKQYRAKDAGSALTLLAKACDSGDSSGCLELAMMRTKQASPSLKFPPKRVLEPLQKGCRLGSKQACYGLAELGWQKRVPSITQKQAKRLMERACLLGHTKACLRGVRFENIQTKAGRKMMMPLFRRGCDAGVGEACFRWGVLLQALKRSHLLVLEHFVKDQERLKNAFDRACSSGYYKACYRWILLVMNSESSDKSKINDALAKACQVGVLKACLLQAQFQVLGAENGKARQKALQHLLSFCEKRSASACQRYLQLAERFQVSILPDVRKKVVARYEAWVKQQCDSKKDCIPLAKVFYEGSDSEESKAKGRALFIEGCKAGNPQACYWIGRMFEVGEVDFPKNIYYANGFYRWSCSHRVGDACWRSARYFRKQAMYYQSRGRTSSYYRNRYKRTLKKASELVEFSCHLGQTKACLALAYDYRWGSSGRNQRLKKAETRFRGLCQRSYAQGCLALGHLLQSSVQEKPQWARSLGLFAKACRMGAAEGCQLVAGMLRSGQVPVKAKDSLVPKDAVYWEKQGCELGHASACRHLGNAAKKANPSRCEEAKRFYKKACKAGSWVACHTSCQGNP